MTFRFSDNRYPLKRDQTKASKTVSAFSNVELLNHRIMKTYVDLSWQVVRNSEDSSSDSVRMTFESDKSSSPAAMKHRVSR